MKNPLILTSTLSGLLALVSCATSNPTATNRERGPSGTVAYFVEVQSSEQGARIYVNDDYVGTTPMTLKIFGDEDGTFHNFGSYHYMVVAYPVRAELQPQTKDFLTGGGLFRPENLIPKKIFFDFGPVPRTQMADPK